MLPGMCMQVLFFSEHGEQEARQKHLPDKRFSLKRVARGSQSCKGRAHGPTGAD